MSTPRSASYDEPRAARSTHAAQPSLIGSFFSSIAKYILAPFVATSSATLGIGFGAYPSIQLATYLSIERYSSQLADRERDFVRAGIIALELMSQKLFHAGLLRLK